MSSYGNYQRCAPVWFERKGRRFEYHYTDLVENEIAAGTKQVDPPPAPVEAPPDLGKMLVTPAPFNPPEAPPEDIDEWLDAVDPEPNWAQLADAVLGGVIALVMLAGCVAVVVFWILLLIGD